jgi:hypothetical protein
MAEAVRCYRSVEIRGCGKNEANAHSGGDLLNSSTSEAATDGW